MSNDLQDTWDSISTMWDRWAPPLRPSPEDTSIMKSALSTWAKSKNFDGYTAQAVLLGVTPEIANMEFPMPTNLLAIDESPGMIQHVWPGDVANQRQAVQGNWLTYPLTDNSNDVVLADGSLVFFNPVDAAQLLSKMVKSLKSDGILVVRSFTAPTTSEPFNKIMKEVVDGYLSNYHEFKFRIAMSLQQNPQTGVIQDYIWHTIKVALAKYGSTFSSNDLSTGDLYKNKQARLYFPTTAELTTLLKTKFSSVQVVTPTYQFGECCPTFIASSKR